MPDAEFHDQVIRELTKLSAAVEAQGRQIDAALAQMRSLPCLDLGPESHAIRLDRLEQAEQRRRWAVRTAATSGLAALATALFALFSGGRTH